MWTEQDDEDDARGYLHTYKAWRTTDLRQDPFWKGQATSARDAMQQAWKYRCTDTNPPEGNYSSGWPGQKQTWCIQKMEGGHNLPPLRTIEFTLEFVMTPIPPETDEYGE